ncbi:DUF397 domain-containing protein [Kitasatospora sp. NPDC048296]|uniref:DUF397 domain-containing protein n=1 Tax=Kitasatospora sp. NPDC048296 TaxID=3364048 RepID=UPI00371CA46E
MRDRSHKATWRKSTYSNGDGDCVEVAVCSDGLVPVRDSKDPHGPVLSFDASAWSAFVAGIRANEFPTTN